MSNAGAFGISTGLDVRSDVAFNRMDRRKKTRNLKKEHKKSQLDFFSKKIEKNSIV